MTDGWMDGRREAIAVSPSLFLKSVGITIFDGNCRNLSYGKEFQC